MTSFRIQVGMYWYGFYAMDDFGNEYPVKSEILDSLKEENNHG